MLRPEEAWDRIDRLLAPLPAEAVKRRQALGRVLAEPLRATVDVPAADVSAMDGFALRGGVPSGGTWPIVGTVAAGDPPGLELREGQAARIMTGAPTPVGADRVIPVELTQVEGEGLRCREEVAEGAHIRLRAEVLKTGDPLLPAGTVLTPGSLSLLATHGIGEVAAHRRPTVAILPTGDEVVPPHITPGPGQLRDSHTDFLLAATAGLGIEATPLGIAPDDPAELERHVRQGLELDVLLLCGGVSMGEFDFVEDVLAKLGCEAVFDAVAVQPGKPLVVARHQGGVVFGLPGNPASVMVTFWLFVRPALRRLLGLADGYWEGALAGELSAPLPGAKGRDRFLQAEVRVDQGRLRVTPRPPRGSHDLSAYGRGMALVRVPANASPASAGDPCEVLPLADWRLDPPPADG